MAADAPAVAAHVTVSGRRAARWSLRLALGWMVLVIGTAVLADLLPIADPLAVDASNPADGPSFAHLLGTDGLGRDLLSNLIHGARTSLLIALTATASAAVLGGLVGTVAGFKRGRTDAVIMALVDGLLAFPALVLALALTAFLGANVRNVIIAIAVLAFPSFARISRAQSLSLSEREFVLAARSLGVPSWRIIVGEILPNAVATIVAYALIVVALAIVIESGLSFLGLGVPPPTATWGAMISAGKGALSTAPHISLFPSTALLLTVLALNVLSEAARDRSGQLGPAAI